MTITAKIITDSVSPDGVRLTTMQLRYPRFIHAEFMTHRAFSRNASSSRAIPVKRLIKDVVEDTAMPIHWGKNQPGMQARMEHDAKVQYGPLSWFSREAFWKLQRDLAILGALAYDAAGYHKQIVNRLLEPFAHINVVVTATDWANFFELRDHTDAQPEIRVLARAMRDAMMWSDPDFVDWGGWHLPYSDTRETSSARCARVSYLTHEGKVPQYCEDMKLFQDLRDARPEHASPFEHQATPMKGRHANLNGWQSFRTEMGL